MSNSDSRAARKLISKSREALESAELLFNNEKYDSAASRAYYSMFDAARASLFALDVENAGTLSKTHNGLIMAFGKHVVKPDYVDAELGKALNRAQSDRLIADYNVDSVGKETAQQIINDAQTFVSTIEREFLFDAMAPTPETPKESSEPKN
jgi:uncharacterized protein (UPF0332 family)